MEYVQTLREFVWPTNWIILAIALGVVVYLVGGPIADKLGLTGLQRWVIPVVVFAIVALFWYGRSGTIFGTTAAVLWMCAAPPIARKVLVEAAGCVERAWDWLGRQNV